MVQVSVAIPHGVSPGQMMQVPYNGMAYQIQVPSNVAAGQTITVNLPDAQPAVVQAVPVASAAVVPNMGPGAVYGAPQQHVPAAEPVEATPKGFESIPNASYVAAGEGHLPTAYFVTMPRLPSAAEVLDNASGFFVRQKVQWFEEFTGWEQANKYKVYWRPENYPIANPGESDLRSLHENHVFDAKEHSDACARQCYGSLRGFNMEIYDTRTRQQVFMLERPCACPLHFEFFFLRQNLQPKRDVGKGH